MISKLKTHSNIVQFFGICLNPLCVVSEFMANGDLRHYLDGQQNKIEKQQMMKWINQISIGKNKKKIILFIFVTFSFQNRFFINNNKIFFPIQKNV